MSSTGVPLEVVKFQTKWSQGTWGTMLAVVVNQTVVTFVVLVKVVLAAALSEEITVLVLVVSIAGATIRLVEISMAAIIIETAMTVLWPPPRRD
jgi:hypothetical protein